MLTGPPGEARHGSEVVPGRGNKTCARGWGGRVQIHCALGALLCHCAWGLEREQGAAGEQVIEVAGPVHEPCRELGPKVRRNHQGV